MFPGGDRIPGPDFIFNCEALCIVGYDIYQSVSSNTNLTVKSSWMLIDMLVVLLGYTIRICLFFINLLTGYRVVDVKFYAECYEKNAQI